MENINFKIDHMDPLGQGVSKENKIAFIENTLPGESGIAEIYRKAKGVIFGRLKDPVQLGIASDIRIVPECRHFNECRGCQFLHTDYNNEIYFKTESLNRIFSKLLPESVEINVHPSNERFGYRNRVQLHYDLNSDDFGLISTHSKALINASDCLLPEINLKKAIMDLYKNNKWKSFINKNDAKKGYIEIYQKPDEIIPKITVNKPYADGGFTQVNNKMEKVLSDIVVEMYSKYLDNSKELLVLDIFGGNGNLSKNFSKAAIRVYDYNPDKNLFPKMLSQNQQYNNIDLYKKDPVDSIINSLKTFKSSTPDLIVFDPPRAGVKFIDSYIDKLNANIIFYISCDPATLKRDTLKIQNKYDILEMHMIDLFPGTRHFETLIIFKRQV